MNFKVIGVDKDTQTNFMAQDCGVQTVNCKFVGLAASQNYYRPQNFVLARLNTCEVLNMERHYRRNP